MIILNQMTKFPETMVWKCDGITDIIEQQYYGNFNKNRACLMIHEVNKNFTINPNKWYITFSVVMPGATLGYIKCDKNGKIKEAKYYREYTINDYLPNLFNNLIGESFHPLELEKISFVYDSIKINPKANKQILWFIANFIFYQGINGVECIRNQFRGGYSLHFAMMLKDLFKTGELYLAVHYGYIVYMHDNIAYSIEGINSSDYEYYVPVTDIKDGIKDFIKIPG